MQPVFLRALPLSIGLFLWSCSGTSNDLVDPPFPFSPSGFQYLSLSNYAFDTDTIDIAPGTARTANDPVKVRFVASVVSTANPSVISARCIVTLDGKEAELINQPLSPAGSNAFKEEIVLTLKRGDVGDYRVKVAGKDEHGNEAETIQTKIRVIYGTNPPEFCGVTMPDTMDLPPSDFVTFKVTACVQDKNGLQDVKRVFFNSFLPNGQPSTGNPFFLVDDGTKGDILAGDGVYSLDVQLPSTAQKGNYRFEFHASDFSNLVSPVVVRQLTVR